MFVAGPMEHIFLYEELMELSPRVFRILVCDLLKNELIYRESTFEIYKASITDS